MEIPRSILETNINETLRQKQKMQPEFILTKNQLGKFIQAEIPDNPLGELIDIVVIQRGKLY